MELASRSVCENHDAPIEFLAEQIIDRPSASLWIGPRGGGKSYISGLGAWLDSLTYDKHGTCILGGSLAQSEQIYEALSSFDAVRPENSPVTITRRSARFNVTQSTVSILAASSTSVRGPHVARLRLDEVDEIDADIREAALGMCMELYGAPASVVMTSTWHRLGGPMAGLVEQGEAGAFPVHRFCAFEVLETCPESRSGPALEHCPDCPIVRWCHSDMDRMGLPKAKRSDGHYTIDTLIQKARTLSARVFESDYLCLGPRADGVWFSRFDQRNISESAEYDERRPVHVAIDSGVFTGAVLFQTVEVGGVPRVNVFADYLAEGKTAEIAAREIMGVIASHCAPARRRISTDSAGGARNPVGPSVIAEYQRAGLRGERGLETWPKYPGCVSDGLNLIDAMVRAADDTVGLTIHPRCRKTIDAFRSYARAKRAGQWQDYPEDPQHPHEDRVDALRGGLATLYPDGRRVDPQWTRRAASSVF